MDTFVRNLLYKKFRLGNLSVSVLDLLLVVCISGAGVLLRESVIDYTPVNAAKMVAVFLDYCMAVLAAVYVYGRTGARTRTLLTYALFVIWPVFAANSALLGKTGSLEGMLLILGLYLLERRMKWLGVLSFVGSGIIWLFGLERMESVNLLTQGWPNIFELTGKFMFVDLYDKVSLLFILGILLCGIYCMREMKLCVTGEMVLPFLLFLAIFIPYFAPYMPAWAGYGADVLAVLFAVLVPKKFYVAFLHVIVSYSSYAFVLNGESKLPMVLYSVILFGLLLDLGVFVYRGITEKTER